MLTFKSNGRISGHSVQLLRAEGLKWCGRCKQALSRELFCNDRSAPDSLNYYCKSCGSALTTNRRRTNVRYRWSHAGRLAKKAGHLWLIECDEYAFLMQLNCAYCGCNLNPGGIGLDRLDDSGEYTSGNVLPSCNECNVARSDHFSPQETLMFIGPAIRAAKLARK